MKRVFIWMLAVALVLSLTATCWAAGEATLTDAKDGPGQTVYVTFELLASVQANTMGIECQFDKDLLEAQPELCVWEREGMLSAFDTDNLGVWMGEKTADMKGKICVLAFRVKDGAAFETTEVTVTLLLKDDAKDMGSYTAKGVVSCECTHDYGDWESTGNQNHARVCSLCGGKSTQPHSWDSGQNQTQPDGTTLLVKTCTLCKAKVGVDALVEEQESGALDMVGGADEDHTHEDTLPEHDHAAQDSHEGHDHTAGGENPYTIWIVLAVVAIFVAEGLWFVKKRK